MVTGIRYIGKLPFPGHLGCPKGAGLLALTIVLLLLGISLSVVVPRMTNSVRRAKEEDLRFCLGEFRRAVDKFVRANSRQPASIEELLRDGQGRRFLRRIYDDPITGKSDWVMEGEGTGIVVRSSSLETSLAGVPYKDFR